MPSNDNYIVSELAINSQFIRVRFVGYNWFRLRLLLVISCAGFIDLYILIGAGEIKKGGLAIDTFDYARASLSLFGWGWL